jgi:hypothetical protein
LAMPQLVSEWKSEIAGRCANRNGSTSGNERMEL